VGEGGKPRIKKKRGGKSSETEVLKYQKPKDSLNGEVKRRKRRVSKNNLSHTQEYIGWKNAGRVQGGGGNRIFRMGGG